MNRNNLPCRRNSQNRSGSSKIKNLLILTLSDPDHNLIQTIDNKQFDTKLSAFTLHGCYGQSIQVGGITHTTNRDHTQLKNKNSVHLLGYRTFIEQT